MTRLLADIDLFLAVARTGNFSTAAHALNLTPSAVSKRVMSLEGDLGVRLFQRTTRRLTLTEEGQLVYEHAQRIALEAEAVEDTISQTTARPRGLLKLALPVSMGYSRLNTAIATFANSYPEITVHAQLDDAVQDLIGGGFDAAVRIGSLADSTLKARKLADCPMVLCASPQYLAKESEPQAPEDLKAHAFLTYQNSARPAVWSYRGSNGVSGTVTLPCRLTSNNGDMLLEACLQGMGIVLLPSFFTDNAIAQGRLVQLLPAYETVPERAIYIVTPPQAASLPKVRVFIDFMVNWMAQAEIHQV
jgi:DNA-binding transcriptional LysR family regulator